jgi:hypothetical protein
MPLQLVITAGEGRSSTCRRRGEFAKETSPISTGKCRTSSDENERADETERSDALEDFNDALEDFNDECSDGLEVEAGGIGLLKELLAGVADAVPGRSRSEDKLAGRGHSVLFPLPEADAAIGAAARSNGTGATSLDLADALSDNAALGAARRGGGVAGTAAVELT